MNRFDEHSFWLHKKQRTGILLLLGILLFLILVWRIVLPYLFSPSSEKTKDYESAWEAFKSENLREVPDATPEERLAVTDDSAFSDKYKIKEQVVQLFPFDPNTASEADLLALGLPAGTVRILIRYREKRGVFYKKEDLKKIYTLTPEDYTRIAPYIQIQEHQTGKKWERDKNKYPYEIKAYAHKPEILDLNETDAATLMELPGIGPVYSKRIIAFRDALGGFVTVDQLKEVYGLPDSTYRELKGRFYATQEKIKKININKAGSETFYRQPYLRPFGKKIIRLRKSMGKFKDIADLKQISLINEENYRKIAPYLTVQ